ncbi:MAG: hypothetical protein KBT21_02005 [Treponema sp.]|nr:hypothetical protein [Candidatus Treponema merdequi]
MILFIFEGGVREPALYKTMKYLFLSDSIKDDIIVSYCSNIYSLYKKMKELDAFDESVDSADIVTVLKEQLANSQSQQDELAKIESSDSISEVYLFFDYDLKRTDELNKLSVEDQNSQIKELLEYFDNETEHGKLFIDYPMVESIRYFKKELPDEDYVTYVTDMFIGKRFKDEADSVSLYKTLRFISFDLNKSGEIKLPHNRFRETDEQKVNEIKENWNHIKQLNIKKANYICSGTNDFPEIKDKINQQNIFNGQIEKYLPGGKIAILNSFPLFLYEYLR